MEYKSLEMVENSRFVELYKKSDSSLNENVLKRIDGYISEFKSYADDKNYNHLCNLFTAMAYCFALEEEGHSREKSIEILKREMYEFIEPQTKAMKDMSKRKDFIKQLKCAMEQGTSGYGWNVDFESPSENEFAMTVNECIYCQIYTKYNIFELTQIFCHVDDLMYENMPEAGFSYTQQKGKGGDFCDYVFTKNN